METAFTEEQKNNLLENAIDNSAPDPTFSSETTTDKVFLLSKGQVETYMSDAWNQAKYTEYACTQGIAIKDGVTQNWMLRTAASPGYSIYYVHNKYGGYIPYYNHDDDVIFASHLGVRPAVYFKDIPVEDNEPNPDQPGENEDDIGYELSLYNTIFENYYRGQMAGGVDVEFLWGWSLFEQDPAQYDHRIAKASLLLSNVVYDNEEKIRRQFKDLGFSDTDTKLKLYNFTENTYLAPANAISSQTYTVDGNEKTIISVVVRGTQNGADFRTDVIDGGLSEFSVSASFVYKCLEDYCNENNIILNDENTILFITGHSLGGAVAGRLEVELKLDHINAKMYVYTIAAASFAAPLELIGDHSCVHNIINTGDFVPKIPPWQLHLGNLYWYDPGDEKFTVSKIDMYGKDEGYVNDGEIKDFMFEHRTATYLYCMLTELPYCSLGNTLKDYMNIIIRCPVDVQVLDAEGKIVGYTEGQTVKNNNIESAIIMLNGDEKYVYLPTGSNCTIQMVGTDDGMMEYTVQSYNEYMEPIETKIFNNVKLNPGKQFKSFVSSKTEIPEVQLWVMDENENIVAEVMEDGQEIPNNPDESACNVKGAVFSPGGINDPIMVQLIDSNNNIVAEISIADNGTNSEYELINLKTGYYTLKTSGRNYVAREYSLEVNEGTAVQNIELFHIGDINGDGSVNVLDNKVLYNHIEGISVLKGYSLPVADVNGDGSVNVLDNKVLYNHIEGISPLW